MPKKLTQEEFIEKAETVHQNRYNYSLVSYLGSTSKVNILCQKHGIFEQEPRNHLQGHNCPKCHAESPKKHIYTKERIIGGFIKIHGDKYDYSKVDYNGCGKKVEIICPIHGSFFRKVNRHKNGIGCSKCKVTDNIKKGIYNQNSPLNTKEFIRRANKKHGTRYDYSKVNYQRSDEEVEIVCSIHGSFWQQPNNHIYGKGCKKCGREIVNKARLLTFEEFKERATKVHNGKYNYNLVNYVNSQTKVKIICPIHAEFEQLANSHLQGNGCEKCDISKGEQEISYCLEKLNINFYREYKFDNCKHKNKLSFDFYIPDQNILIEYDGEQHFKPMVYFGGKKTFKYIKKLDNIKNNFAKQNGYNLLRIKYTEFNNIQTILKKFINGAI